jgi:hypothetical protein
VTLADARIQLGASMGNPKAIEALRQRRAREEQERQRRLDEWLKLYLIRLDGALAVDRIKRESAAKLAEIKAKQAATRRREEAFSRDDLAIRWRWAREDSRRDGTPVRLEFARRKHQVLVEQTQTIVPDDAPWVPVWRGHAEELLRTHAIECTWEPHAAGVNAYAWASLRRIEVPPIISAGSYSVFLHEFGHVLRPCEPSHVRVKTKFESCCVRCEPTAWLWAIDAARPFWTRPMHDRLSSSLRTYESYGTEAERAELAELTSPLGYHRIRLQRATAIAA